MYYMPTSQWLLTMRNFMVALCLITLGGCFGDYQLVSFGPTAYISGWHQYVTPRHPESPIEDIVIEVARTQQNQETAESDILYIITDFTKAEAVQVVDVASKAAGNMPFPERTVSRYRITDGMITAMSDPTDEFYVNADLERAILRAIALTWAADRVLIYNNGTRSMSIVSYAIDKCTSDVKIYNEGAMTGVPIASKRVAFCFVK